MPTGLVVMSGHEKSQIKNKEKAFKVLKSRLFDLMQQEQNDKIAAEESRRSDLETDQRELEHNFPTEQNHRPQNQLTLYKLDSVPRR